jgi:hypothetical protein
MSFNKALLDFAHKYGPKVGTSEYAAFMNDLRVVVVEAQRHFRYEQVTGQFTDGGGDKFLSLCRTHNIDPMKEA